MPPVLLPLLLASCQQGEVAYDFCERLPEERATLLGENAQVVAGRNNVAGVGYAAGYGGSPIQHTTLLAAPTQRLPQQKQLLVKKGSLRFGVKGYAEARHRIGSTVEKRNGYVSSERETKTEYRLSNEMTIRAPADQFDSLVSELANEAKRLDEKQVRVEDVTEEFVDLEARLHARKQVENRYLDILDKANTVKDILEVEQKLGAVREDIEASEGRLKYLSHQVAYSTVDLSFYEDKVVFPKARVGFATRLATSLVSGWRGLTEFVLGLATIWPLILCLGGLGWVTYRVARRVRLSKAEDPML